MKLEHIATYVNQYGYIVLFFSLMFELIALPLPGEIIMSYCGFLVFQGRLNWISTILVAGTGASAGITIAYWTGFTLGTPFLKKYGSYIHMGPERLDKVSLWFQKYGNKMLSIAYFIPGVRHVTGYFSGITRISFRKFALFAYLGAFIWSATFISIGKLLGPKWEQFHSAIKHYLIIGSIALVLVVAIFYFYRTYKQNVITAALNFISSSVKTFHSLGRVKALVAGTALLFLIFFALMIGLIQDYLANEFLDFDMIVSILTLRIFPKAWNPWMIFFSKLVSLKIMLPLIFLTLLWIKLRNKNKVLESIFLFIATMGGIIISEGLSYVFYRIGLKNLLLIVKPLSNFPSEQSLMVVVAYGFIAYLFVRHTGNASFRIWVSTLVLVISALVGLSHVFLGIQNPSDVVSGYVFGGVWLTLNIIMLEVFRVTDINLYYKNASTK